MSNIRNSKILELYRRRGLGGNLELGERIALIIVDMQYGFTDPNSPLGTDLTEVKNSIKRLLNLFRTYEKPIYFTRIIYDDPMKEAKVWIKKIPALEILKRGTRWVEIDEEIKPRPNEIVIDKKFASAFFGTDLNNSLQKNNIDTIVVAGCTTSGCIRATVVDGLQYGYRVFVPLEGVGDRNEEVHYSNLVDIQGKYGEVIPLNELIDKLSVKLR